MQIIRTIIWVLILVGVLLFSFFNWSDVEVTIWDNLVLETKVPALVIISFLLGFLPTWLYARGVIWSLNRKIRSLEIAAKASSVSAAARESDREEAARQDEPQTESEPEAEPEPETQAEIEAQDETDARLTADDASPNDASPNDDAPNEDVSNDAKALDSGADDSATPVDGEDDKDAKEKPATT